MRGLPFFKPKKGAQFAGLGFSDGSGGGSYVLPTASADTLGGVKVGNNLSIDANGVLSAPDCVDPSMIAGTESTTTSTHAYAIGEYFISSTGLLCKATSEIAIDDTISIGTSAGDNAESVTVGGEISELNSKSIIYIDMTLSPSSTYGASKWRTVGTESDCFIAPCVGELIIFSDYSNYYPANVGMLYVRTTYSDAVASIESATTIDTFYNSDRNNGFRAKYSTIVRTGEMYIPLIYDYSENLSNTFGWIFIPANV